MIETYNLQLIPCQLIYFEAILRNKKKLEMILDISIADSWPEFTEAIPLAYNRLKANPSLLNWWMYLFIHIENKVLIGSGGFKGQSDELGRVEIGYEIIPEYRNRGLATEAAQGLIDYAFSHVYVKTVESHTLPEKNASTRVLEKVGMKYVGTVYDPDDGAVWHWYLSRKDYEIQNDCTN